MNKYFDRWNILKKEINFIYNKPYHPKNREIWWVNVGFNIGSEIFGKGDHYSRPVLIVKVFSKNFIGLPLSSNIKKSKYKYIIYTNDNKCHSIILNQIRLFDSKRLIKRKYILSKNRFKIIINRLKNMITTNLFD